MNTRLPDAAQIEAWTSSPAYAERAAAWLENFERAGAALPLDEAARSFAAAAAIDYALARGILRRLADPDGYANFHRAVQEDQLNRHRRRSLVKRVADAVAALRGYEGASVSGRFPWRQTMPAPTSEGLAAAPILGQRVAHAAVNDPHVSRSSTPTSPTLSVADGPSLQHDDDASSPPGTPGGAAATPRAFVRSDIFCNGSCALL